MKRYNVEIIHDGREEPRSWLLGSQVAQLVRSMEPHDELVIHCVDGEE